MSGTLVFIQVKEETCRLLTHSVLCPLPSESASVHHKNALQTLELLSSREGPREGREGMRGFKNQLQGAEGACLSSLWGSNSLQPPSLAELPGGASSKAW